MNQRSEIFKKLDEFGRFQTIQYILICFPLMFVTMTVVNYVFVAEDIDYRCRASQCEDDDGKIDTPLWWPKPPENKDIRCFRPGFNVTKYNNTVTCATAQLSEWEECTEWVYDSENSLVAGLDLGCKSWIASLVGSVHNAGMIASMVLTGWLADKIGRKPTIIICGVSGVVGVVKIFITNYYFYLVVEFIESFLSSGLYTVGVVLLIEVGGESKRVLAGVIFSYATYAGEASFALLAMSLKYWKYLILAANGPSILFLIYVLVLKESTRWQMLRGKMDDAKETFKSIIKMNKLEIPPKEIEDMSDVELRKIFNVAEQKEKESVGDIIRSKEIMTRLLVTSVCFFTSAFVYCGLLVHSVNLPGNKYTNYALVSVTSFPGDLLAYFTFKKFGRRITLQFGYFATAIFIMAQAYTPEANPWIKISLFLSGKFAVVVCFTGIFTYSMELFPTSVRGSLIGCGNTAARVGSMLSPLTCLLTKEMEKLPSFLFCSTSVLAGVLLVFLPETKDFPLFDTIAQVEAYGKKEVPSNS